MVPSLWVVTLLRCNKTTFHTDQLNSPATNQCSHYCISVKLSCLLNEFVDNVIHKPLKLVKQNTCCMQFVSLHNLQNVLAKVRISVRLWLGFTSGSI